MAKKDKKKTSVTLPKAWQTIKHRNETANAKNNYEDAWKAAGYIALILLILFILLGGVSQTGVLKFLFNWSYNVGEKVSDWLSGGSVITNEDGIYIDPSGEKGDKIIDESTNDVENPADIVDDVQNMLIDANSAEDETSSKNEPDTSTSSKPPTESEAKLE